MKKTKLLKGVAISALTAVLALAGVACGGGKVEDNENTLEIYICDFGYGTAWLDNTITAFKNTDWVKEKYPNLNIPKPEKKADQDFVNSAIMEGKSTNTADLLFTCSNNSYAYFSSGNYLDLTSLYATTIPGETQTVQQKMKATKYSERLYALKDGTQAIYSMPWVNGYMGLFLNKTTAEELLGTDYEMPKTTDELLQMCEDIKNSPQNTKKIKPFISCAGSNYWTSMFSVFWAQYEGMESYTNFYEGTVDGSGYSDEIFSQEGRRQSLLLLEKLMGRASGNSSSLATTEIFSVVQAEFLAGTGVMMPNGDWLENEMSDFKEDEITILKNPVISTVINKCVNVDNDEQLSFIVGCVDEGKTFAQTKEAYGAQFAGKELTQGEFEHIESARNMTGTLGGHEAYIPSYSTSTELAKDFLLFMASDKGIEAFMDTTNGCMTAFNYDVQTKNKTLYDSFSLLQKDHAKIDLTSDPLPEGGSRKLYALGGMKALYVNHNLESRLLDEKDYKTGQQIFDEEKNYYQANRGGDGLGAKFKEVLQKAGVLG